MIPIRLATAEDVPTIIAIMETSWHHTYPTIISSAQIDYMLEKMNQPEIFNQQITSHERSIFLALSEESEPVAFANTGRKDSNPTVWRIHQLYALPNNQRNGIGKALIGHIGAHAEHMGCNELELNVNRANSALGFYEKQGFSIVESVDIPYGPFVLNDYVMRRKIGASHAA